MTEESGEARLLEALEVRRGDRARTPLATVWEAFHEAVPHLRGHPEARPRLRRMLDELVRRGQLRFPKTARLFDRVQTPPLPRWVQWPRPTTGDTPRQRASTVAWHPLLAAVPDLPGLTEAELEAASSIQRFLAQPDGGPWLTVRERSLRLFGDDKRLEELAKGRLFGPSRLELNHLRCRLVSLPVVSRDIGPGDGALIVENKDTFVSACRALERLGAAGRFRWVLFGAGHAINRSISSLLDWEGRPGRLVYFGDLDARGLEIALQLTETASSQGLPPVESAGWLYEALVGRASAMDLDLQGRRCQASQIDELVAWLPASIRAPVAELLARGGRWPQEALTEADFVRLLSEPRRS